MNETSILKRILLRCSRGMSRLFRTNSALAWVGQATVYQKHQTVHVGPGDVVIRKARRLRVGHPGWSDLTGWRTITIKPEHVGFSVAQFAVLEVKTERNDATEDQLTFGTMVTNAGGLFAVVRSADEAEKILSSPLTGVDKLEHTR